MLCRDRAGVVCTRLVYQVIAPHRSLLASWISAPLDPSGYGLGDLLNHLRNVEKETLAEIVDLAIQNRSQHAINVVTVDDCHSIAVMLGRVESEVKGLGAGRLCLINRDRLFALADNWPT